MVLLLAGPASAEPGINLAGTWHVLVHYKDDNAPKPERERWQDRIWVFDRVGNRLRWREYPIVVFSNESGRFERRASGRKAGSMSVWWAPIAVHRALTRSGSRGPARRMLTE